MKRCEQTRLFAFTPITHTHIWPCCHKLQEIVLSLRNIPVSCEHLFPAGMCLQAFVEAFFCLAQKKYKSRPLHEQVASLVELCECRLAALHGKRLLWGCGLGQRHGALPATATVPSPPRPRHHQVFGLQKPSQLRALVCRDTAGS